MSNNRQGQDSRQSWWRTVPGLTAAASVISAVAALVTILHQAGFVGTAQKQPSGDELQQVRQELQEVKQRTLAEAARLQASSQRFESLTSGRAPADLRQLVAAIESANRTAVAPNPDVNRILNDPSLQDKEKIVAAITALTSRTEKELRSLDNSQSISMNDETAKLKVVDKRSEEFDLLRQIIDKYNETARQVIDNSDNNKIQSIGR